MRKALALCLSLILCGCATFGQMQRGLKALQWQDIQTAFDVLGYPSGKQEFGTDTVYFWEVNSSGTIFLPQTTTTSGYVGMAPVQASTTYNQSVPVNYNCLIRLITDDQGIIKSWEYRGNYGGCTNYINRLNRYYKQGVKSQDSVWLGIICQDTTEDLTKNSNLSGNNGAIVLEVFKGGPCEKAGIKKNDIIIRADNKEIHHAYELMNITKKLRVGQKIRLAAVRNKKTFVLDVVVSARPQNQ
jgi:hypothetical protein